MASSALELRALQALLDARFPNAMPAPSVAYEAVGTGIEGVDRAFPHGGFPKGRLAVWAPGGGASAVLRAAAWGTVARGDRVVWIDGAGVIAGGAQWGRLAREGEPGPVLVRPVGRIEALRAAEHVVRSGGFSLVVVTGADPVGTENVRLSRAAHESGAACVVLSHNAAMSGLRIVSRIAPSSYKWEYDVHGNPAVVCAAMLDVQVSAVGWNRRAQVELPVVPHDVTLALDPALPDRRGTRRAPQCRSVAP